MARLNRKYRRQPLHRALHEHNRTGKSVHCPVFAKIQRDVISGGIFTSVADLARKLRKYIEVYTKLAKPFRWTYTDPQKRIRINEITGTAY
jgi:hypothetical protein